MIMQRDLFWFSFIFRRRVRLSSKYASSFPSHFLYKCVHLLNQGRNRSNWVSESRRRTRKWSPQGARSLNGKVVRWQIEFLLYSNPLFLLPWKPDQVLPTLAQCWVSPPTHSTPSSHWGSWARRTDRSGRTERLKSGRLHPSWRDYINVERWIWQNHQPQTSKTLLQLEIKQGISYMRITLNATRSSFSLQHICPQIIVKMC